MFIEHAIHGTSPSTSKVVHFILHLFALHDICFLVDNLGFPERPRQYESFHPNMNAFFEILPLQ